MFFGLENVYYIVIKSFNIRRSLLLAIYQNQ